MPSTMYLWSILSVSVSALGLIEATSIPYDQVKPIPAGERLSTTDAAFGLRPSLLITSGCHPYPAVDASGQLSAGLPSNGGALMAEGCGGSPLGSQIYERARMYKDKWAAMYAWYAPKNQRSDSEAGQLHDWANIVIWPNGPFSTTPIAVSTSLFGGGYKIHNPLLPEYINGTATKIEYRQNPDSDNYHDVNVTNKPGGEFQDFIRWTDLTREASMALETADFGPDVSVPFIDANFERNLELAFPF